MSRTTIEVLRAGALTTVQDLGRPGFRAQGVPAGGAFDPWSARAANRLVGNPDAAALLEITLLGPMLRFDADAVVAIVGDPFAARAGGREVPLGRGTPLAAGTLLDLGRARRGVRCWLAVAGGLDVAPVLGSRSTDLAGGFGGFAGRALGAGDRLPWPASPAGRSPASRRAIRPAAEDSGGGRSGTLLRILPGPDGTLVAADAAAALARGEWRVGSDSDRRGVRLQGTRIAVPPHDPLRSSGVLPGAIQLPPSGEPIVLGVDAPVTGGYPWAAQVIEADVGLLAHLAPGDAVRFERVDYAAAERALARRWDRLAAGAVAGEAG